MARSRRPRRVLPTVGASTSMRERLVSVLDRLTHAYAVTGTLESALVGTSEGSANQDQPRGAVSLDGAMAELESVSTALLKRLETLTKTV